jgi:ABC-type protease/lipase transport system fused ATPase/permease subunit
MSIADKLLVLNDGKVQAFGPREEVAAKLAPPPPAPCGCAAHRVGDLERWRRA